jgi:hypothetical protein
MEKVATIPLNALDKMEILTLQDNSSGVFKTPRFMLNMSGTKMTFSS